MNDQPAPFSPFSPTPPPADPAAQGTPTKKRAPKAGGEKKEAKLVVVKEAPVPTRKRARSQHPTMIPFSVVHSLAGLKETETDQLMRLIAELQPWPKKSRAKIVTALGKVFA